MLPGVEIADTIFCHCGIMLVCVDCGETYAQNQICALEYVSAMQMVLLARAATN